MTVEPNGLLSENMLVYGSLHIVTQEGMEWTIDVELQATTHVEEWWMIWNEPAKVIGLMLRDTEPLVHGRCHQPAFSQASE